MSNAQTFEFLPQIPATEQNAIAIQALTLQDVIAGGFTNPESLANPEDPEKVDIQLGKLTNFPERYSGYRRENGLIVAYLKANEWLAGDEVPFIENAFARRALQLSAKLRGGSLSPKAFGVFGLVADESLSEDQRSGLLGGLLDHSITEGLANAASVLNIVIHDNDPVLPIARDLGFEPVGPRGEATGAPGLKQQRYQRPLE